MEQAKVGALGYFMGRLARPDELTIAFLSESEMGQDGFACLLRDIGPENLRVVIEETPIGTVIVTTEDKRDPTNFSDRRERPIYHATRFIYEFGQDGRVIVTVGDLNMNLQYAKLRLEITDVEYRTLYLN